MIMTIATLAVIESASNDLLAGFIHGAGPDLSWRHGMHASAAVRRVCLHQYLFVGCWCTPLCPCTPVPLLCDPAPLQVKVLQACLGILRVLNPALSLPAH